MKPKKAVKEYERSLKKDPQNINIRVKLAAALREVGRADESAKMYLSVARAYREKGRLAQALAVCKSVLDMTPGDGETQSLLSEIEAAFATEKPPEPEPVPEPTRTPSGRFPRRRPSAPPEPTASASLPVAGGPEDDEVKAVDEVFEAAGPTEDALAAQAAERGVEYISPRLPQALAQMAAGMKLKSFVDGDFIVREGDPGSAIYLIVSGRVRILKRDPASPQSDLLEIAQLGEGAIFGEFAVLADMRRHATVQVMGECSVYEIPKQLLLQLTATYPELADHLLGFYRERLQRTLLDTAPFFQTIPADARRKLVNLCESVRCEAEQTVLAEGVESPGLYVVLLGSVDVVDRDGKVVDTLGEGTHFGAQPLLRGTSTTCSVVARGPTELALLPAAHFYNVVSEHPILWDQARTEAAAAVH